MEQTGNINFTKLEFKFTNTYNLKYVYKNKN